MVLRKRAYPTCRQHYESRHSAWYPLLDILHPPFEKLYRDRVYLSLFKDRSKAPVTDRYLHANLRATLNETDVDGKHAYWLPTIGFHFGRLHGAILSPQTG